MRVAEQYVEAFGKLAKESNTLMLPTNAGDPASMVAQALGVFKAVGLSGPGATKTVSGTTPGTTSEVGRERVGESVDGAGGRPFKLSK